MVILKEKQKLERNTERERRRESKTEREKKNIGNFGTLAEAQKQRMRKRGEAFRNWRFKDNRRRAWTLTLECSCQ